MNKSAAPPHFLWDDPLLLDEQLTDEERLVRDSTPYCPNIRPTLVTPPRGNRN
jgi:hypothetical protein